jgi:uncharacterized protein (DUF1499 family)
MSLASESINATVGGKDVSTSLLWPRVGLALALLAALAELVGGLGYRLGWWPFGTGIQTIRWAASFASVLLVLSLIALVWARIKNRTAQKNALIGVSVLSLIALILPTLHFYRMQTLPRIHDITTDSNNPPAFEAVLGQRKDAKIFSQYDSTDAAQQAQAYPDLKSLRLSTAPGATLQRAEEVAKKLGWEVVKVTPSELRLEATATSMLFGFKDDIVVRVTAAENASVVDVRSKSRVGRHDFGVNATRIRAFLRDIVSTP